jgi:hypothetical protein
VENGNYEEWKLISRSSAIRDIRGRSMASTVIKVVNKDGYGSPMFFIPTDCIMSTLILSSLTFVLNTTHSLVSVNENGAVVEMKDLLINSSSITVKRTTNIVKFIMGSSIQLVNVRFNNISLQDSALKIDTGNVFFSSCVFTNINLIRTDNTGGEGGVLHITVDDMKTLELADTCEFENCTVNTAGVANGGAIFVHLKLGYFYTRNVVSFKNCSSISSNNGEGKGYTFFFFFCIFFF